MGTMIYNVVFAASLMLTPVNDPVEHSVKRLEIMKDEIVAERLDSLFTYYSTQKGFNGNVLIAHEGKILYKNCFGYSDIRKRIPLNIESVFQLASVSKQFTAMAIMMLEEEGALQYTDPVTKFIPSFPYPDVTVWHLLTHRSGLPNYMYFAGKYWKNKRLFMDNDDLLRMMSVYRPRPDFRPDQRYRYSNTGYAVLASIVERVSRLRFDEFMEKHVFQPLGMANTFVFNHKNAKTVAYQTLGHNKNRRKTYDDFLGGVVGDKGIYSTVDDMYIWDQMLYTDTLVQQSTLEEAFTPISFDYKHNSNYGYGWRIDLLEDGRKIVYHAGWWRGYNSLFVRRLDDRTSIIVLSNKVNWSFRNINRLMSIVDDRTVLPGGDMEEDEDDQEYDQGESDTSTGSPKQ